MLPESFVKLCYAGVDKWQEDGTLVVSFELVAGTLLRFRCRAVIRGICISSPLVAVARA